MTESPFSTMAKAARLHADKEGKEFALVDKDATNDAAVDQLSDGYHTFAELYQHRHALTLALMHAVPNLCWFSQRHWDGELPFGSREWFIVGADFPTGSITYHLPIAMLELARQTGACELATGRPWDGHTADDVIQRLREWATAPALLPSGDARAVKDCLTAEAPLTGHLRDAAKMVSPPAAMLDCQGAPEAGK